MLRVPSDLMYNVLEAMEGRRLRVEVMSFVVLNWILEWGIVRNKCAGSYVEMEYAVL